MRLFPKKMIAIYLLMVIPFISIAQQDFQGKAYYQTKTTMDLDNWGRGQMSEQQKKQIMERMKSFLEKQYILTFTQSESIYKEDEKLEAPGAGGGRGFGMMSSFTGGAQYKNVKEQELLQEQDFFGKQFLIKDSLPDLQWEMGTETKQIGQYTCFKATAVKKVDEFDWSSMRRRNRDKDDAEKKKDSTESADAENKNPMDEIEVPKEIIVTAWYTPQIPVNNGPGEYSGLPGLILEINADRTTMLCTKIVLNPEEKDEIKKPSKGKEVTRKEYNEIVKNKMEEMREMYGGRRGGGRGR
ncbi:GLPGLI family protein [Hanstruepera ponticola]|uniref:GLPGLI family protein n=1 Tax=Hanstruepera ponticola TaxID=2042995 RepID=UPI001F26014F|nr:GLPGLI family protein [Hanstruepera ponticola]